MIRNAYRIFEEKALCKVKLTIVLRPGMAI